MFDSGAGGGLLFGLVAPALLSACEAARGRPLRNEAPKPSTVDRSGGLSLPTYDTSIIYLELLMVVVLVVSRRRRRV